MNKYPTYFIFAIVLLGIIKLLQVTIFDAEKYAKNKESSFSDPVAKEKSKSLKQKSEDEKPNSEKKNIDASILNEKSTDTTQAAVNFESEEPDEAPSENLTNRSNVSLSDLKNNYLAVKIANLPSGQLREDVVIRYYKHEKDGNKVYPLKKLGYYIHEKKAEETQGLGSNVLYYGQDVNIEDIQIVAFTLLANGLPIKSIERSQFEWKSNAIEIGTDTLLLDAANLTDQDIANFSK